MRGLYRLTKSPYWWMSYVVDGKLRRESTKLKDKNKALIALARKKDYAQRVKDGEAVIIEDVSLSELFRRVILHSAGRVTASTIKSKTRSFELFVNFSGDVKAKRVNNAMLESFQSSLLAEGIKPQTVNLKLIHIRTALRKGNSWDLVPEMTIKRLSLVKPLKVSVNPRKAMSLEELNYLLASAGKWKPLLSFIAFTGCRISEAYNLKWSDVNLKLNFLTFRQTKNGDYRQIPLLQQAREVIDGLKVVSLDPDAWVFMPRVPNASNEMKRVFTRAKLPQYSTHSLRHTFVSLAIMAGASESTVQQIVGHKSNKMTRHYTHLSPEFMQAEMERLGMAFRSKSVEKVQTDYKTATAVNE